MNVLMIGATGEFAGMVVPELKKRGVQVRALIREESQTSAARERGVDEIAIGNLQDTASLRAAAQGMDGVFHINPAFAPHETVLTKFGYYYGDDSIRTASCLLLSEVAARAAAIRAHWPFHSCRAFISVETGEKTAFKEIGSSGFQKGEGNST